MRRVLAAAALLAAVTSCKPQEQTPAAAAAPARGTREWKIQSVMAAAPASITSGATIAEMNPSTMALSPLRPGTNGWTCVADDTTEHHMGAICVDEEWAKWFAAWVGHKNPNITKVGTAYMLAGANDASNTDPFATKPDSGKSWVVSGPHIMIIAPGAHAYDGLPHEPNNNAPYVMFPGTPYAHVMAPTAGLSHGGM